MENQFKQFSTWLMSHRVEQYEKQNLYREVVRRAHTAESTISPWYRKLTPSFLSTIAIMACMIFVVSYKQAPTATLSSVPETETPIQEYQVLSAYEQAKKISQEKASLTKIIKSLPKEQVASSLKTEMGLIEQYLNETKKVDPVIKEIPTHSTESTIENTEGEPLKNIEETYSKLQAYVAKENYTEALILIDEVKKDLKNKESLNVPPQNKESTQETKKQ